MKVKLIEDMGQTNIWNKDLGCPASVLQRLGQRGHLFNKSYEYNNRQSYCNG